MLRLAFNPQRIPRTTTRAEWREIDRWRRELEKRLKLHAERSLEALVRYGTTHPEVMAHLAEEAVNPPILVGPHFVERS